MADNTQLDAGSGGDLISTDDIGGGVKVQRVKVQHGADGSATDVSTASPMPIGGPAAHDAAVSGNPVLNAGEARTALATAVGNGDVVRLLADVYGRQIVRGTLPAATTCKKVNFTTGSAADLVAAVASTRHVVVALMVTNHSGLQATKVTIRDGTTEMVAGSAGISGGGWVLAPGAGEVFTGTSNTAVTAICGSSGADVDVTIVYYSIPA